MTNETTYTIVLLMQEVEQKAPNNAYVIFVFGVVGMILQVGVQLVL